MGAPLPPQRLLSVLFGGALEASELQELYDYAGRSTPAMRRVCGLQGAIKSKALARKLHEFGVLLTPTDLKKAGIHSRAVQALENSQYALFDLGDAFDPAKMMEEAVESDLDPSVFEDMDLRELPRAKNILEWVTGRRFLNTTIFPRQLQINLAIFEEWCPYCSDRDFVQDFHLSPHQGEDGYRRPWTVDEMRSRITMLEHGVCPKCGKTYVEILNDPSTPHCAPNEVDACVGQRAGKTRMTEHMMTYNNHRFQLLAPSPQQFFGEDITQKFSAIFTALQLSQAQDTLWGAYHLRVLAAPWYKTYHAWLDDHAERFGTELYRIKDTYHWWANTMLHDVLRPPYAKEMRGRTGYQMGIDEIGMFSRGEGRIQANADEVHKSMNNALLTLREDANSLLRRGRLNVPTPGMFCVSSPWELLDKIMTLVRTADRDPTRVAFHYPTWEFNPRIRRDSPQIEAEYIKDPVGAERDFGALPPFATDPFHTNTEVVDALVAPSHQPLFAQKIKRVVSKRGNHRIYAMPKLLRPDARVPRIVTLDAGETDNSFAIGVWSLKALPAPPLDIGVEDLEDDIEDEEDEDVRAILEANLAERRTQPHQDPEQKGHVEYLQCDGLVEIQPETDDVGIEWKVHFRRVLERCILPICRTYNIIGVFSDRWNITQALQTLDDEGYYTEQYSLTYNDFVDLRAKVNAREIRIPEPERDFKEVFEDYNRAIRGAPILHLLVQIKTVRQVGRTVTKPRGGTDDLYRTLALAHRFAFSEDAVIEVDGEEKTVNELLKTYGKVEQVKRAVSVVLLHGGSAGGQQGGTSFTRVGGYVSRGSGAGGQRYSNVQTRGGGGASGRR